jgi:RND superfamily putative drug exporter
MTTWPVPTTAQHPGDTVERSARFVLRHRLWVVLAWLVVLVAGGAAAGQLGDRLSFDFSLPGQEGYETEVKLAEAYGTAAYASYIPVFTASDGTPIEEHKADVEKVSTAIRAIPGLRVVDYPSTGDKQFITDDGKSTFALVYAPQVQGFVDPIGKQVDSVIRTTAPANGLDVKITGYNQLQSGSEENEGPSILAETLLGASGALVVLVFVFASFLALVPLLIAAVAILATFLIVLGLTTFTDISFVVQFLISLVGLGVAIDYSLLLVSRWREERAHGVENDEAVVIAVKASGITVAISLVALVVVPVPLIRSMGFGGMLIPVVSTAVVLTLLPALLSKVGPKVDWPRIRHEGVASRGWTAWARGVVKYRWVAAGVAIAALALAIFPVFGLQIGQTRSDSLASNGEAHDTLVALKENGVGTGVLTTINVLVQPGNDPAPFVAAAQKVDGVRTAVASKPGRGGVVDVIVVPDDETVDSSSVKTVDAVRDQVSGLAGFDGMAGLGATVRDYDRAVYQKFPFVLAVIALVTFLLLVRTFRSLLLPLKAVILNLLSVAAVFGVATWFWQDGHGSNAIFGITETGAMTFWIPVLIFAFLFGLSMDYEVFILARMREEYDATGSTAFAVERGLGRTGRLVTSAALILFFAFAALASAPGTDIKVFATALGVGILLDATLVRALLVPALVSLFGKWNWWLPAGVAKVLRVEPSPLKPDRPMPSDAGTPGSPGEPEPAELGVR